MAFDLSQLAAKDTTTLHLKHPKTHIEMYADEAKTQPIEIELYGTGSKVSRNAILALQNKRAARGKAQVSAEQIEAEWVDVLVACTKSIKNLDLEPGKPLDNPVAYKELYLNPQLEWVQEQVNATRGDVANFLTA